MDASRIERLLVVLHGPAWKWKRAEGIQAGDGLGFRGARSLPAIEHLFASLPLPCARLASVAPGATGAPASSDAHQPAPLRFTSADINRMQLLLVAEPTLAPTLRTWAEEDGAWEGLPLSVQRRLKPVQVDDVPASAGEAAASAEATQTANQSVILLT